MLKLLLLLYYYYIIIIKNGKIQLSNDSDAIWAPDHI